MAKILVVDDRPVDRDVLATLLRYRDHVVHEATDGEDALARARAEPFDLIIADVLMPRLDGFRLLRELRADPALADTAVLFYTAGYDTREAQDLTSGFGVSVLPKPSEPPAILDAVDRMLDRPKTTSQLPPEEFDRRHLRLLSDKLHEKAVSLEESNAQLTRLVAELRAEVESRRRAEAAAEEQREWLRVVLASIGDAVIATDTAGRVVLLNPVAEAMTGWPQAEAVGRPLDGIFRIINEEHRGAVESPVARVLREGTVQGLANHTVLIARDGTERAIDDCAAPIREAGTAEVRGVVLIFHDVTERREMERQLVDRAEKLAEAGRHKDEFLVMLAHELRNPLAPIRNGLHVLRLSPGDPRSVGEMREIMQRQVEHLARLVDDLLDVSRITRGRVVLRTERIDLVQLARQAAADHRARAGESGVSLAEDLPPGPIWVDADPIRLKQVADNLLGNALKFTDRGGSVAVAVAADAAAGEASLTVRDTGIGIEAHVLPRVFDPFAQADRSLDRGRGGLGLGLALVRGLVDLHGGSVEARSEGQGRGAEFTIRLRAASGPAAPAWAAAGTARLGGGGRVLLIEDSPDVAETMRRLLHLYGYDVAVAHTGLEGVDEARRSRPPLIVCDIGLPGMDGFAVASALRADPATAGARLIALTGYGRDEDIRRARAAGFDDYVIKPADPDELLAKLAVPQSP
jgi:PAS domain S-box-containing protein